jgi:hypothetical protein
MAGEGYYDYMRQKYEALEAEKTRAIEAAKPVIQYAIGSLEHAQQQQRLARGRKSMPSRNTDIIKKSTPSLVSGINSRFQTLIL